MQKARNMEKIRVAIVVIDHELLNRGGWLLTPSFSYWAPRGIPCATEACLRSSSLSSASISGSAFVASMMGSVRAFAAFTAYPMHPAPQAYHF